jgi:HK97 gp10 family phage protein
MTMLSVDLSSLNAMLEQLGDRADAAARPAAQAAAQVFYDEMVRNVEAMRQKSGNLRRSLYQVYSTDNSAPGRATYHISYNHRKAPHGQLVEFGHIQRYVVRMGKGGQFYTVKRPESAGKPRPRRNASQAEKDAYYLPLPAPKQIAAKPFIRPAMSKAPQAIEAAAAALTRAINEP